MDILQEYSSGDLYMRYAVDSSPDDKDFTMHIHDNFEVFYFVSGNAGYLVEGSEYSLEPGNILIMRPSESHRAKILNGEKYERYAINFSARSINCIDSSGYLLKPFFERPLGRGNLYYSTGISCEHIRQLFSEVFETDNDNEKRLRIFSLLLLILNGISKEFSNRKSGEYPPPRSLAEKIVMYVNSNLFEKITVTEIAQHFFLSNSQLGRIFRQATGTSPWEYITVKRLTAAKEKIRSGMSAHSTCIECGFGDYSSFYRAYVKYFGCSPKLNQSTA